MIDVLLLFFMWMIRLSFFVISWCCSMMLMLMVRLILSCG